MCLAVATVNIYISRSISQKKKRGGDGTGVMETFWGDFPRVDARSIGEFRSFGSPVVTRPNRTLLQIRNDILRPNDSTGPRANHDTADRGAVSFAEPEAGL